MNFNEIKSFKELEKSGYNVKTHMMVCSTDRSSDSMLGGKFKSFEDFKIDHPEVLNRINRIVEHNKTKGILSLEGGEWLIFRDDNDIGWSFISIGYFTN